MHSLLVIRIATSGSLFEIINQSLIFVITRSPTEFVHAVGQGPKTRWVWISESLPRRHYVSDWNTVATTSLWSERYPVVSDSSFGKSSISFYLTFQLQVLLTPLLDHQWVSLLPPLILYNMQPTAAFLYAAPQLYSYVLLIHAHAWSSDARMLVSCSLSTTCTRALSTSYCNNLFATEPTLWHTEHTLSNALLRHWINAVYNASDNLSHLLGPPSFTKVTCQGYLVFLH